jgi:putative hydrolase of HD superfamily
LDVEAKEQDLKDGSTPSGEKAEHLKGVVDFFFEAGMLKRTPRSGLQFLGSGSESVAEHIFRVVLIGYTLSQMVEGVDSLKLMKLCLIHDLVEARTGDLNYVNKKYVRADEGKAVRELAAALPFGAELEGLAQEFAGRKTRESQLANDADQLEMILLLKEYGDLGNRYAKEWTDYVVKRLQTDVAKSLAHLIWNTDSNHWWFKDKGDWWVNGGEPPF